MAETEQGRLLLELSVFRWNEGQMFTVGEEESSL